MQTNPHSHGTLSVPRWTWTPLYFAEIAETPLRPIDAAPSDTRSTQGTGHRTPEPALLNHILDLCSTAHSTFPTVFHRVRRRVCFNTTRKLRKTIHILVKMPDPTMPTHDDVRIPPQTSKAP